MKLQFTTSTSDGFVEGQVIEVAKPSPQLLDWLRRGVLCVVRDLASETALAPRARDKAIARREGRGARSRTPRRSATREGSQKPPKPAVPLLCPGGTVVCIGGGPSLTPDDVEYCRGRADAVIAINDAYRLAPWAQVLYAADEQWWSWHKGVSSFSGLKYSLQRHAAEWGVQILEQTGDQGLEPEPTGLRTGLNSGYQAINLAVHLGAKRILLLGYDMSVGEDGRTHWFGNHPGQKKPSNYPNFAQAFPSMRHALAQLGVEVINCSRRSALDCFPRQPLREALSALEVSA